MKFFLLVGGAGLLDKMERKSTSALVWVELRLGLANKIWTISCVGKEYATTLFWNKFSWTYFLWTKDVWINLFGTVHRLPNQVCQNKMTHILPSTNLQVKLEFDTKDQSLVLNRWCMILFLGGIWWGWLLLHSGLFWWGAEVPKLSTGMQSDLSLLG